MSETETCLEARLTNVSRLREFEMHMTNSFRVRKSIFDSVAINALYKMRRCYVCNITRVSMPWKLLKSKEAVKSYFYLNNSKFLLLYFSELHCE